MPNPIFKELAKQPCLTEFSLTDWQSLVKQFSELVAAERKDFITDLAQHSGVPITELNQSFLVIASISATLQDKNERYVLLQKLQNEATLKIIGFQKHNYFKDKSIDSLPLSRTEWLSLIHRFAQQNRKVLTAHFFLFTLSDIKNVSLDTLLADKSFSRQLPERESKRLLSRSENKSPSKKQYVPKGYEGQNRLIFDSANADPNLENKIQASGARCTTLIPATPDAKRAHQDLQQTPGGSKVRVLCQIGRNTFFQPLSPVFNRQNNGRIDVSDVTAANLLSALPDVVYKKAARVEFIATRELINDRIGKIRGRSQKAIKNASCSDVFRAHGIIISSNQNHNHHWAHLIAYFLGGAQGFDNLVPSTAAANYNTLEAVELRIKALLTDLTTDKVQITVDPQYIGEALIPDLLVYTINWQETTATGNQLSLSETFNISPKSYERISKSMHKTIDVVREEMYADTADTIQIMGLNK